MAERLRGEVIVFCPETPAVQQILHIWTVLFQAIGLRRMGIIGKPDGRPRARFIFVRLLTADPAPRVEATMEVLVRFELVVQVRNDRRRVTGRAQTFGERNIFGVHLVPSTNSDLIVWLLDHVGRKDPPSRINRPPAGYSWQNFGITVLE